MGTVIFHPCYSVPSFLQPKLGAPIFFLKGIADGSPRLKVSCRILDGDGDRRNRPPRKMPLRSKTPKIKESDIKALVRQVQSSLRQETADKKTSKETDASSNEKKSPAAAFWENHLLSRKEKNPAKEGNGILTKLLHTKKQKIQNSTSALDSILAQPKKNQTGGGAELAQHKKNRIIAEAKTNYPLENQPIVDLRSTRPRSKFVKRSPIPPPELRGKKLSSEALPAVVAAPETEEPEFPTLDKMKLPELRLLAKSRGVKVYYKLKKNELLAILKSQE